MGGRILLSSMVETLRPNDQRLKPSISKGEGRYFLDANIWMYKHPFPVFVVRSHVLDILFCYNLKRNKETCLMNNGIEIKLLSLERLN